MTHARVSAIMVNLAVPFAASADTTSRELILEILSRSLLK